MKKILLIISLAFFTFSSFSQKNSVRILLKENKQQVISDSSMMFFLKKQNIDINDYNVVDIDSVSNLTSKFLKNKINFTLVRHKFYFLNNEFILKTYEKNYYSNKRKKLKNKFIYCYRTLDKNSLNLYEMEFYILK